MHQRPVTLIFPLLLVFYEIATYLSNDMYLPALPAMMKDLGLTAQHAQFTLTTWFIGSASMPMLVGALADRWGRKPILLAGGVIYILSTVICAMTTSVSVLLFARFIQGGMVPFMMVPGYAVIHESYEQKDAVRLLALMGSISVLAPALGPLLGSIVLYFLNWEWIFWLIALWALIAILLLSKWMPETLPAEKREPIHLSLLFKKYGQLCTNKRFMLLMCVLGFIFAGFIAWITAGPLLIIDSFHYSAVTFGLIQAGVFAVYIFANRWVKHLLEKIGMGSLILAGLFVTLSGGVFMLLFALIFPFSLYAFIMSMMIYSFGSGLCFAPLNRLVIEASEVTMGVRVSFFTVMLTSFAALGSGMASLFFDGSLLSLALLISTVIVLAGFFRWLTRSKTAMSMT